MTNKALSIAALVSILAIFACDFGDSRTIRMTVDGNEITAGNARIAISREGDQYYVLLVTKKPVVKIVWKTRFKDVDRWRGMKYRADKFKVEYSGKNLHFEEPDVGVIIEITDVSGDFVSGKFSGPIGVGGGSHRVDNGTFRAPAEFWNR